MQSRQDKQQQDQHTGIMQSTNENHAIKTNSNKINKRESCNHSEEVDRQLNLKAVEKKHTFFKSAERLEKGCRLLIAFDRGSGENRRESWETRKDRSPPIETRGSGETRERCEREDTGETRESCEWERRQERVVSERDTGETRESCDRNQRRLNLDVVLYRRRERHGRDKRELWERRRGLCPTRIPSPIGCCHLWRRTSPKTS